MVVSAFACAHEHRQYREPMMASMPRCNLWVAPYTKRSTPTQGGGGGRKKNPGTGVQLFFRGGGGTKKKLREILFWTPKAEIFSTLPHLFGFGRCKEDIFEGNH